MLFPRSASDYRVASPLARTVVATRAMHSNSYDQRSNGIDVAATTRMRHTITADSFNLQFLFSNTTIDIGSQVDPITVRAGYDDGTIVAPIYFGGKRSILIDAGGYALSDPIPALFKKGDIIWIRSGVSVNSTLRWPLNHYTNGSIAGEAVIVGSDATLSSVSAFTGNSQTSVFGCLAVLGSTTKVVPCIEMRGDSIQRDGSGSAINNYGLGLRACGSDYGKDYCTVLTAVSGSQRQNYLPIANRRLRTLFTSMATSVYSEFGTNDVYLGLRTLSQMQSDVIAELAECKARGQAYFISTIMPYTTSTDGWTTTTNQTVKAQESVRVAYNDWLRVWACSDIITLFDVANEVETSRNSGIWKVIGQALTVDGLHPNEVGFAKAITAIDPTQFI